jgi:hypothetical protein
MERIMSPTIILFNEKKKKLVELLSHIDKKRKYNFYIASCYFDLRTASYLIKDIYKEGIHIERIKIYIDKKEVFRIGKNNIQQWLNRINKKYSFNIDLFPVVAPKLFHTKIYALIACNFLSGVLISGSANLTRAGLTSSNGNIESLIRTRSQAILKSFQESLLELEIQDLDKINLFDDTETLDFKYALLRSGYFLYTWSGSLNRELGIKFMLSDKGKEKIKDAPILKTLRTELGFELSQASISKSYLNFSYNPPLSENIKNLKKNFGIETYLGYWVPISVINRCFGNEEFEKFKRSLFKAIEEQQKLIVASIKKDYETLCKLELIEKLNTHPEESFLKKVEKLKDKKTKLWRLYYRYELIELPYDFSQHEEIEELYNNFIETCEAKSSNYTIRAVYRAINAKNLGPINIDLLEELEC